MGHAQDDLVDAVLSCTVDGQCQERNQALRTGEREGLHGRELATQEVLEGGGVGQLGEDPDLLGALQLDAILRPLHPILQPVFDLQIVDVHELHANRAAVGVAQAGEHLAQRERLSAEDGAAREFAIQIVAAQTVELGVQLGLQRPG